MSGRKPTIATGVVVEKSRDGNIKFRRVAITAIHANCNMVEVRDGPRMFSYYYLDEVRNLKRLPTVYKWRTKESEVSP